MAEGARPPVGSGLTEQEVIPAGHAHASRHSTRRTHRPPNIAGLGLAALGVVFGDIGTSPIYTFRECFNPEHGLPLDPPHVLGILSMVLWALIIVVAIKYVVLIMRADNHGEGGILALLALALEPAKTDRARWILTMLAIGGAALFYGDSMITPAISVLSAFEGFEVATPVFHKSVVPLTVIVLVGLFLLQKGGTERVGLFFGPIMAVWFVVIGAAGVVEIAANPSVLWAINPGHAARVFIDSPLSGFIVLGTVALAITGGEALYADMGHFGALPIKVAWFVVVLPALVLNYFGQGALVLADKSAIDNPFFHLAPTWGLLPLVILSSAATVIASQSVISGAFSLSRQAMQLGILPQLDVFQTSDQTRGQIYVAQINWLLLIAVIALVLGFQSSSALASAYGFAVTGTMTITTILAGFITRHLWRWSWLKVAAILVPIISVDLALFSSNALKIPSGGWFPLAVGIVVFVTMTTWRRGRQLVGVRLAEDAVPLDVLVREGCREAEARVSGTAVFLTGHSDHAPISLLNNLRHNKVLHKTVLVVRVLTENIPYVTTHDRIETTDLGEGFWRILLRFGFAETPNVPRALRRAGIPDLDLTPRKVSFFIGRANVKSTARPGMARWRERLYTALARIATRPTEFFHIPPDRVIELGTEVDI
ncbi:MAG: potassium transporter Kup [Alphaproteobacteria bacterium]|nr:potassium transporter Kup [Alphaproteobacteria bacterium]